MRRRQKVYPKRNRSLFLIFSLFLGACDQLGQRPSEVSNSWTWLAGSQTANQLGTYGTQGTGTSSNTPGGRTRGATWTDTAGNLWLFGGFGYSSQGSTLELNDFWKFDGTNWVWISGTATGSAAGVYGTVGEKSLSYIPGSRAGASFASDQNGRFYLFGGNGYDRDLRRGRLNDLWMFDGTYWIYLSGSSTVDQASKHGLLGIASPTNIPGAREDATCWVDTSGALWIFGGYGLDKTGRAGRLNDLWKFDGSSWVHMAGHTTADQKSNFGPEGSAALYFTPGARYGAASWMDENKAVYLYGGTGYSDSTTSGNLNDLWRYNADGWAIVGGGQTVDTSTSYDTGTTATPGGRSGFSSWRKNSSLVLFGGDGKVSGSNRGAMSDLWSIEGLRWSFIGGPQTIAGVGTYGTLGETRSSNQVGARTQAMTWVGSNGTLFLFGGSGYGASTSGLLNDLWKN